MAGGGGGARSLEQTPTWAVAVVCFVLVVISLFIEQLIHLIAEWLTERHKRALYEALQKVKSELMLLGFISLLLTVGQGPISNICVPTSVGDSWHPCRKGRGRSKDTDSAESSREDVSRGFGRKLLLLVQDDPHAPASLRRVLASKGGDKCGAKGKVPLVSSDGIHQLHIFIFVLAVFHVLYCIVTMTLGRLKMRRWKSWEKETRTAEYQFSHDPDRFQFTRETSFGRRHLSFWSKSPILIWIVCFFRQFVRSVPKVDYLTLRHGFIMAHLAPQSSTKFDFQKYIKRSLEEDFIVVVGINPVIWFFAVLFLLCNTHGWYSYLWLPFIPLFVILLVGTKLQVVITRMALQIMERGDVIKGIPVVQPTDDHFWFNRPQLILYLIHFVLFQNAFQLAFFVWSWYQFGLNSCFHEHPADIGIRISMGILVQVMCSYVTLPLYALVTQMGSNMKTTVFNERVATALRKWHQTARKHVKDQSHHNTKSSGSTTPWSRPATPTPPPGGLSPVHLLHHHRCSTDLEEAGSSGMMITATATPSTASNHNNINHEGSNSSHAHHRELLAEDAEELGGGGGGGSSPLPSPPVEHGNADQRSIEMSGDFSFDKRQ